jgi:hypothetical protein
VELFVDPAKVARRMPEMPTEAITKRRHAGITDLFGNLLHLQPSLRK